MRLVVKWNRTHKKTSRKTCFSTLDVLSARVNPGSYRTKNSQSPYCKASWDRSFYPIRRVETRHCRPDAQWPDWRTIRDTLLIRDSSFTWDVERLPANLSNYRQPHLFSNILKKKCCKTNFLLTPSAAEPNFKACSRLYSAQRRFTTISTLVLFPSKISISLFV